MPPHNWVEQKCWDNEKCCIFPGIQHILGGKLASKTRYDSTKLNLGRMQGFDLGN